MRRLPAVISIAIATATLATAQVPRDDLTGDCEPASAEAVLESGNVRAKLYNNGNLFLRDEPGYEVPRGSGIHAMFTSNLWIAGRVDGELRTAGSIYTPREYWPGPLDLDGRPPDDCSQYDRFWSVTSQDIDDLINDGVISSSVADWPADLGAPFQEINGEAGYQPDAGDRPLVLGDQMYWWVMNDRGNEHGFTGTLPLGIEVQVSAWAFNEGGVLGNSTFYHFTVVNHNERALDDLYVGLWSDVDVGYGKNDATGTDTTLSMIYGYNGVPDDGSSDGEYGTLPPAIGLLPIPSSLRHGDFVSRYSHTMWAANGGGSIGGARDGEGVFNSLRSRWTDGQPLTIGGVGRGFSVRPTDIMFPGDPVNGEFWSFANADSTGSEMLPLDVRMIGSFGPTTLNTSDSLSFSLALVWSQGSDYLDSVSQLREDAQYVLSTWRDISTPRDVGIENAVHGRTPKAAVYPNPASAVARLLYTVSGPSFVQITVVDPLGRQIFRSFERYEITGEFSLTFSVEDWPPGVYFVRLQTVAGVKTIPFTVL